MSLFAFTLQLSSFSVSRQGRNGLLGLTALLLTSTPSLPAQESPVLVGTVIKVIDGDTIDVKLSSGLIRVRGRESSYGIHPSTKLGSDVGGRRRWI
jgi:hypothetical protein